MEDGIADWGRFERDRGVGLLHRCWRRSRRSSLRGFVVFFSESCRGKATVAYTMPQQRKKEESERLRGERDPIKFIDLRFDR